MLLLKRRGYEVETALDIASALERAGGRQFDVLVSDMVLPDGSGLDLLRRLADRAPKHGGIVVSGYGQEEDVANSLAAGFKEHLAKPVNVANLDAAIQQLVR